MTRHNSVCVEELRWDRESKQERGNGGERKERGIWKEGGSRETTPQAWKLGGSCTALIRKRVGSRSHSDRTSEEG